MRTIIEFDQRYFREQAAIDDVPHTGTPGWEVVPVLGHHKNPATGEREQYTEWRLRLHTDRPLHVLKQISRVDRSQGRVRTYRVVESDGSRSTS
jgi:hypothetical protein